MTDAPRQLTLDLPHRAADGSEDFLVSPANAAAVRLIDEWPAWPGHAVVVVGPAGCGKSHLVNVWRTRSGAARATGGDLDEAALAQLAQAGALAVEDVDRGVSDERVLFHALNLARETRLSLLVTSAKAPGDLDIALPDLRSRLRALPLVEIAPPDDALLRGLLVKLFSDRQLKVEPAVIDYLARHMERSAAAARAAVEEIDRLALATRRKVSRQLAAVAVARVGDDDAAE